MHYKNESLNEYVGKSVLNFMFNDALCLIKTDIVKKKKKASPSALKVMHSLSGRFVICMFLRDTHMTHPALNMGAVC